MLFKQLIKFACISLQVNESISAIYDEFNDLALHHCDVRQYIRIIPKLTIYYLLSTRFRTLESRGIGEIGA